MYKRQFYLDVEGKIAAVDTTSTLSSNYAYLADAGLKDGFDKLLEVKVFTKEGETKILTSTQKIKLNGKSGQTPETVLNALKKSDAVAPQLVTFETNKDGELTQINTCLLYTSRMCIRDRYSEEISLPGAEEKVLYVNNREQRSEKLDRNKDNKLLEYAGDVMRLIDFATGYYPVSYTHLSAVKSSGFG